jgi:hypothetical protein
MSLTASYLFIWFCALAAALLAGLFSQRVHSEFQPHPDKLFDGAGMADTLLNELMSPEHRVFGHYDEVGWWKFYSWRNYAMHAAPCVFIVLLTGLLYWNAREEAIACLCSIVAGVGLSPLFCP